MKYSLFICLLATCGTLFFSCKKKNPVEPISEETAVYDATLYNFTYSSTLSKPNLPNDNQLTNAKVELGRKLFYDKQLSGNNSMACAGCHNQNNGFSDSARFSTGIAGLKGGRQAMPIFNLAWHSNQFFWDGRANLLRDQALLPIQDILEMNEKLPNVVSKLKASPIYPNMFIRAFGTGEVNSLNISYALEAFMMTIISDDSKYDKFLRGETSLSASEERGRVLFFAEYNPSFPNITGGDCAHCHGGGNFENDRYMNNGLNEEGNITDEGRKNATQMQSDKGKFKVPSLRNIAVTGPYMHDGRFATLEQVIDHYNEGIKTSNSLDPALANTQSTGLMLDAQEKTDLVNFLKTLTDPTFLSNSKYSKPN
jgi:cytochrome c peroxidase